MTAGLTIEFVGPEQAALVHAIMLEAFREYEGVLIVPVSAMRETFDEAISSIQRGGAVLARFGDQTVGSARFEPRDGCVYIGRVSVLPDWRGRGIATEMMRVLEDRAVALGFSEARIATRGHLPRNIALY